MINTLMLPFNGPLPCLVLPPNHWIKLVAIVLHCLYWEMLEFIKKIKNQTWLFCTLFQIQIFFFFSLPHPHHTQKNRKKKKEKRKEGWVYLTHMVKSYI